MTHDLRARRKRIQDALALYRHQIESTISMALGIGAVAMFLSMTLGRI